MGLNTFIQSASVTLIAVAWKVAGAIVLWLAGRWLIGFAILEFTPAGPQLCVRPYCQNQHYWQVYFDTNRLIRETFGEAGYPAPMPAYAVNSPLMGPPQDALPH